MIEQTTEQITETLSAAAQAGLAITVIVSGTIIVVLVLLVALAWIRTRGPAINNESQQQLLFAQSFSTLAKSTERSAMANEKTAEHTAKMVDAQFEIKKFLEDDANSRRENLNLVMAEISASKQGIQTILDELQQLKSDCDSKVNGKLDEIITMLKAMQHV